MPDAEFTSRNIIVTSEKLWGALEQFGRTIGLPLSQIPGGSDDTMLDKEGQAWYAFMPQLHAGGGSGVVR